MDRELIIARLKAARRADRAIDTGRSVDSIDPTGLKVVAWRAERAGVVEAMRRQVESMGTIFGLEVPGSNKGSQATLHEGGRTSGEWRLRRNYN